MAWCRQIFQGFATREVATAVSMSTLTRRLNKETKKISIFSKFIRRNSSTPASSAAEEINKKGIMEEESLKDNKSLYLCFVDCAGCYMNVQIIRSIRLSHLLAPPVLHGGHDLKLHNVVYRCGPNTVVPATASTCVIGSKIVFPGGLVRLKEKEPNYSWPYTGSKEVSVFETDPSIDSNPKLQPTQDFKITRVEPVLVEVDNKLYRFDSECDCESFEVFEPLQDEWLPLDAPPKKYLYLSHAVAGTKILFWGRNQNGVYMFDVTYPEKGWTELDHYVGSYIQSIDGDDQIFVKLKSGHGDGNDGKGFLMFSINMLKQPHTVLVAYMSHTFDSLKHLEHLHLPAERPPKFDGARCMFFHLGGQKVGLVFSYDNLYDHDHHQLDCWEYDSSDGEEEDGEEEKKDDCHNKDGNGGSYNVNNEGPDDSGKGRVLVVIFEYEIVDEESMDIKYKLLTSRCLEYSAKYREAPGETHESILKGAHLL